MKVRFCYSLFFLLLINTIYAFDREKLDEVVNTYILKLEQYAKGGADTEEVYFPLVQSFSDFMGGIHQNDLYNFGSTIKSSPSVYLSEIKELNFQVKMEIYDEQLLECSYSLNGNEYALATFRKEINYQGKSVNFEFLLLINVNSEPYKIEQVVFTETQKTKISQSCTINDNQDNNTAKFERELLAKAKEYYKNGDYISSKEKYEQVLMLNQDNSLAIDGIKNCEYFINSKQYIDKINKLIENKSYNEAINYLDELKSNNLNYNQQWFTSQKQLCIEEITKIKANNDIKEADYYFNNRMYSKAKELYQKTLSYNQRVSYITKQIEKCNQGDPDFVKKELSNAYNAAVSSKKNWVNTFKTYVKYENSGLLKADQFVFMCKVLLGNYSNKIRKSMGYSRKQTIRLSKYYFYKAKNLGYDVSKLRYFVFTKSIEKQ